jgi:hypothetical protein
LVTTVFGVLSLAQSRNGIHARWVRLAHRLEWFYLFERHYGSCWKAAVRPLRIVTRVYPYLLTTNDFIVILFLS